MFPMLVTLPDGRQLNSCRVHSTPGLVTVYWWDGNEVQTVAVGEVLEADGKKSWFLNTDTGRAHLVMQSGCGCGHVLRRWRPPTRPVAAP